MQLGVLPSRHGLTSYACELLRAWGCRSLSLDSAARLRLQDTPVVIAHGADADWGCLNPYMEDGGTVICLAPEDATAARAGLRSRGLRHGPAFLRLTAMALPGLAGEVLPVVGPVQAWSADEGTQVYGYLCDLADPDSDTVGIAAARVGRGCLLCIAFDLPRCVLLLRQGNPDQAEWLAPGDAAVRPAHLAWRMPLADAGWVPFADLLARLLLELAQRHLPGPMPLLSHLPGTAPAVLLFTGDEDSAAPEETQDEMAWLASQGARMDLYVIPERTPTTPAMLARYLADHDAGPHPDLRPLDGRPMADRLEELERQIRAFIHRYGFVPRCLRNHCLVWAGYTEAVAVLERCGVRMDANYTSGQFRQGRRYAPYGTYGGALPIRFGRLDGGLHDVYQVHTHIMDDIWFAPDSGGFRASTYSYRFTAEAFAAISQRLMTDMARRLHTPLTVCIHPSNWARYSRVQAQTLVQDARSCGIPVWSLTQWSRFWDDRDPWTVAWDWSGTRLSWRADGPHCRPDLQLAVPRHWAGRPLARVWREGAEQSPTVATGRPGWALLPVDTEASWTAQYGE